MNKSICSIFLCLFFLFGCSTKPDTYQFTNPIEEVTSVVLISNQNESGEGIDEENFILIRELDDKEISTFMHNVHKLQTSRRSGGPLWGYGSYIAKVTYANGDVEILGTLNIEYVPNGTLPTGFGSYYFDDDGLWMLISDFIQISGAENSPPN